MGLSLNELLAADPSALRHSDWVELQRLARDEIAIDRDNLKKLKPLAARMREIDALVSGGRLLDAKRLVERHAELNRRNGTTYEDDMRDFVGEQLTAFAAALLTDGAVAAFQSGWDDEDSDTVREGFAAGIRAAIRAAGVEPVERAGSVVTVPVAMYDAEKARADKAHEVLEAERAESRINRENAAREAYQEAAKAQDRINQLSIDAADSRERLAALETVIAETSHAAGISGTMTSAARVLEMGRAITQERNMSHDCQKDRNATLAKNRELNERATKAEGALVQMTKEADELRKAYASREAYDASIKATIAAESACKALRAEVAALRGLDRSHTAVCCIVDSVKGQLGQTTYVGAQTGLREALATVPPAKVADAVKPEPAGLEPLGPPTVPGFPPMHYRGLVGRVNELSAIAKRGGS